MNRLRVNIIRLLVMCCVVLMVFQHAVGAQNLVTNPGFENGTTGWHGTEGGSFALDGSVAHTGASSVRYESAAPHKSVQSVWYKFTAVPGYRYKIGAWVKVKGFPTDKGGAAVDIVWFDKNTRAQIARKTSQYLIGSDYDWVNIYCETASVMPANVGEAWILLQVRAGSTGTAWFDDVCVERLDDTVFEPMYKYPNYRHTILPGMSKRADIVFDYSPGRALAGAKTTIKVDVVDVGGKAVSSSSVTPSASEQPEVGIDLSDLSPGEYTATCTLLDKSSGKIVKTYALPLIIAKPADRLPKVYFDSQNRCIVDGKPFFPRGFYTNLYADYMKSDLTKFSSAGFNTTLNYSMGGMSLSAIRKVLDNHDAAGMKAMVTFNALYDHSPHQRTSMDGVTGNDEITRYVVNGIKDKKSLLAYYINEERIDWMAPALQHKYDLISKMDAEHPVYQVLGYFSESMPRMHFPNCDVIGYDCYPLWEMTRGGKASRITDLDASHIGDFYDAANRIHNAGHGSVPNWMVVPCSTVEPGRPGERPPSYDEVMLFTYQSLVNGSRGLMYWYYSYLRDHDGEAQWDVMKRVGAHLTAIEPLVLADDADSKHRVSASDERIKTITRAMNGKLYVLAVNSSIQAVTSRFELPVPILKIVSHGLPGSFKDKLSSNTLSFSDRLLPMQTRVYELVLVE